MSQIQLQNTLKYWKELSPIISVPKNEEDYDRLMSLLDELLEIDTPDSNVESLVQLVSEMIRFYDEEHYPIDDVSGVDALHYLMKEHHLTQSDLPEIGSQGVVSEILNGKRTLNVRQIKYLATRFQVSPQTFL
jgi:HTH-type transcriptional regulator / antitoxin HigA